MSSQQDSSIYRRFLQVLSCKCGDRTTGSERVIEIHERNPEVTQTVQTKQINNNLTSAMDSADKAQLPTARPGSRRNSQHIRPTSQIEIVGSSQQALLGSQVRKCHDSQIIHIPITSMLNPQIKLSNTKYFEGSGAKNLDKPVAPPIPISSQMLNHLVRTPTPKNEQIPIQRPLVQSLIKPVTPRKIQMTEHINKQMLAQLIRPNSGSVLESTKRVISRPTSIPKIVFTYENPRQSQVSRFVASGYKPSEVSAVTAISNIQSSIFKVSDRIMAEAPKSQTKTVPTIKDTTTQTYTKKLGIELQQQIDRLPTIRPPVNVVDYATFGRHGSTQQKSNNTVVNLKPEAVPPPSFHSTFTFNQQYSQSQIPQTHVSPKVVQTSPNMYRFVNTKHVDSIKAVTKFNKSQVINDDMMIETEGNAVSHLPDQPSPKDILMGDSTVQP